MAKSTPMKGHLQPRARLAKQAAARTDVSALQPVNLNEQFDHLTTRTKSTKQTCSSQDDGADGSSPIPNRASLAKMLHETLAEMRPETTVNTSRPPTSVSSREDDSPTPPISMTECMAALMKQMVKRMAAILETAATTAAIAAMVTLALKIEFVPAPAKLSIAARQQMLVLVINAVKAIKAIISKYPTTTAAIATSVAAIARLARTPCVLALPIATVSSPIPPAAEHQAPKQVIPLGSEADVPAKIAAQRSSPPPEPEAYWADEYPVWANEPKRAMEYALSAEELKSLRFGMAAEDYEHWIIKVKSFLEGRYPHAASLLSLEYDEASELIIDLPRAADTNKWLGNQLRAALDTSRPAAELFIRELMDAEADEPGISSSGIDIADRIRSAMLDRDSSDMEAEWTKFKSETYLKLGMQDDAVRLAIRKISNKIRIMPSHVKDAPHAVLRAVISKMPSSPAAMHAEKAKYLRALDLSEKLHEEPVLEGRVLNVARISEWIVNDIKSHSSNTDREASAAEKARRKLEREESGKKGRATYAKETIHGGSVTNRHAPSVARSGAKQSEEWCASRRSTPSQSTLTPKANRSTRSCKRR